MKTLEVQEEVDRLVELVDLCIVEILKEDDYPEQMQQKIVRVLSFHVQRKLVELQKNLKEGTYGNY